MLHKYTFHLNEVIGYHILPSINIYKPTPICFLLNKNNSVKPISSKFKVIERSVTIRKIDTSLNLVMKYSLVSLHKTNIEVLLPAYQCLPFRNNKIIEFVNDHLPPLSLHHKYETNILSIEQYIEHILSILTPPKMLIL